MSPLVVDLTHPRVISNDIRNGFTYWNQTILFLLICATSFGINRIKLGFSSYPGWI